MKNNSAITKAIRLALLAGATGTAMTAPIAMAAEEDGVERIVVTGSAIKRTDLEGALPVQVIDSEAIAKSGVTNVPDLIQQLPAMQGFTTSSDSVGGGGGGMQTASIHDLGSSYTLVLLNGRRLAPAGSGSTINLNSIPFAAIDRVELLTDGASALYGSDAIAGVVNFILKKDFQGFDVSARYDMPEKSGGKSWNGSITAGLGELSVDGYNLMVSYTHESQEQLASNQRDFAKTGIIPFMNEGRELYFFNGSGNGIPGNARVTILDSEGNIVKDEDDNLLRRAFNPYFAQTGACAPATSAIEEECWFDYTSTIEIIPEQQRDSVFTNAHFEINEELSLFIEANWASTSMTSRIAPYPTGWFKLPSDSQLVTDYIVPYLTDDELAAFQEGNLSTQARWRALPAGNRTTEWDSQTLHFVTGLEGVIGNIDYSAAAFYSSNDSDQNYPTGWLLEEEFVDAVSSGNINVFVPADEFDASSQEALDKTIYSGNWDTTKVAVAGFDFKASMPVFELPAGEVYMATGFDWRTTSFDYSISDANRDELILFKSTSEEYDLERINWGIFAEFAIPVFDNFDVSASVRYDNIGEIDDNLNDGVKGVDQSDITYKISGRYQATEDLLVRASYGTGFKAPSMLEIARPRDEYGVTGGNYECPFPSADALAQYCLSGKSQYPVYLQGNEQLKPETSAQATVGFVYAPSQEFSVTVDYWKVQMEDQVASLTEAQIFADAELYRELFTTKTNSGTGEEELAILMSQVNVGESNYSGIDWSTSLTNELSFGTLVTAFSGTYMIESEYTKPGTDEWVSSMGRFGDNNSVTFRVISQLSSTLVMDAFSHTLRASYKSGYRDQFQSKDGCAVTEVDAFGDCVNVQLSIPSYTTWDYQTKYFITDDLAMTFGVNNLLDATPSLSLRSGGAGHQVGYDPRYTDSFGRTYYLQADYSF